MCNAPDSVPLTVGSVMAGHFKEPFSLEEYGTPDNSTLLMERSPATTVFDPARVREHLGRDWSVDDLQVIMASYFGFISRWEPDGVVLEWMS